MASEVEKRTDNFIPVILAVKDDAGQEIVMIRVDPTTLRLKVTQSALDKLTDNVLSEEEGHGAVSTFRKVVTTGGSAVQLDDYSCKRCVIQALSNNTNPIEVGDANVVASEATQRGVRLFPTQSAEFLVNNTNLLYIDAVTDGEGVSVFYEN